MEPPSPRTASAFAKAKDKPAGNASPDFEPRAVVITAAWPRHNNNRQWHGPLAIQPSGDMDQWTELGAQN